MGFSLNEIKLLLSLRVSSPKRCESVRLKAQEKLSEVDTHLKILSNLKKTLKHLIHDCENKVISDCCPILEKMEK